ncbi:MAG: DUF4382 domain-containing protein [Deltaproteobacteria bacterium]|nr:DUF4382 domain-containing protein [Deltaproteobacteria bacterium]
MRMKNTSVSGISRAICLLAVIVFGLVSILATGGGGGGSSSITGSSGSEKTGAGTVGVSITDGPADDYDEIWIQIREVSLIPENDGSPVTVWQSSDANGHWINLLQHRDEEEGDFLLTINRNIPEGVYTKVRLEVGGIYSVGGECDLETIHLPSGKIDLNPREAFEVKSGMPIWVCLDIDANKSIDLHPAGKSGKCIFRPVVFVDIQSGAYDLSCPLIVQGEIGSVVDSGDPDFYVTAFVFNPDGDGESLTVRMQEDTVVFDNDGLPLVGKATSGDLKSGDRIWVRGTLDENGELPAAEIVVGRVQALTGTVQSEGVDDDGVFSFFLDPDQAVVGQNPADQSVQVKLYAGDTLLLLDCNTEGTENNIFRGVRARVIGKYHSADDQLRAVAVMIKPIAGELVTVEEVTDGQRLRIRQESGTEVLLLLPEDAPVKLRGDGRVPNELLCTGRKVLAIQDTDDPQSLSSLIVESTLLEGWVTDIDDVEKTLTVSTLTGSRIIQIDPFGETYTTILANRDGVSVGIEFDDIDVGDYVNSFGLDACESGDEAFYAFIIITSNEPDDDDYGLPHTVNGNHISLYLPEGIYQQNLLVNGNDFRITGEAGSDGCSSDDGWSVIRGDVSINGNNAVFKNIYFDGEVEINGNNADFINCCFAQ